jgi:hypothetical protein
MEAKQPPNRPVVDLVRETVSAVTASFTHNCAASLALAHANHPEIDLGPGRNALPAPQQAQLSHSYHVQPLQIARQTH